VGYPATESAATPERCDNADQLSLLVFHAGTRSIKNPDTNPNAPGGGFKVLCEKQWGPIVAFASYTHNTAKGGGADATFSGNTAVAGAGYLQPFGIKGEMAIAGMWSLPFDNIFPGSGQRGQYGVDAYWNMAITQPLRLHSGEPRRLPALMERRDVLWANRRRRDARVARRSVQQRLPRRS
jgi:hypothetical protein